MRHATPDVAFVAETAADVASLAAVAADMRRQGRTVVAIDVDYVKGDEGATTAWLGSDVPVVAYNDVTLGRVRPRAIVARRPAGPVTLDLLTAIDQLGGLACLLAEPPRGLELEEAESACSTFQSATVDELAVLVDRSASAAPDRTPFIGSSFVAKLRQEESESDEPSVEKLADCGIGIAVRRRSSLAMVHL